MASNAVEQLKRLVAPPSRPSGEPAWQRFRDEFGCAPPSDYAQFVKDYGLGSFDNFLWVFHPSSREHLDIVGESQSRLLAMRELIGAGEQVPYAIGDGRSEVIPWACTDNGDVCFWAVSPGVSP